MVLVHDTSSDCALQMYEVSLKHAFVTDRLMDKTDWWTRQTDGQDRQTQGEKQYASQPFQGGDIILSFTSKIR